jgi:N6-adenosine-specific RNA methylase IME4
MEGIIMRIDKEFKNLISPLSHNEYQQLEQNIIDEGCRDALVVWQEENILLDGHNRFYICENNGIEYDIIDLSLPDRNAAMLWILSNQLGRRNLTDEQRTYYLGARYELEKLVPHRPKGVQNEPLKTYDRIADETGNSASTIKRAAKYKQAVDKIAEHSEELKDSILAGELGTTKKEILQLGKVLEQEPEIGEKAINEIVSGNGKTFKQGIAFARRIDRQHEAQQLPDEVFNVIYADPPWQYSNSGLEGSAEKHYPTMPTNEICELVTNEEIHIADNAVLFLWVTNPLLIDGLQVIKSWGFKYKTNIVWAKPYKNMGKSGWYIQGHHELLLIATRGNCIPHLQPQSVQSFPRQAHSVKPLQFREMIEDMYPHYNYLELFARNQPERNNWIFWGNES